MFICYHCGFVSHDPRINYCNNPNCKNYGCGEMGCKTNTTSKPINTSQNEPMMIKRSLYKTDSYHYEGDFNYPSDKNTNFNASFNNQRMDKEEKTEFFDYKEGKSCGTLAFATVPMQNFEKIYSPNQAMNAGTIFPSLHMPYDKKILWRG